MKQHKWHKEIKAWADGAEIEFRKGLTYEWESMNKYTSGIFDAQERYEFRIKPQPKEPQYLYAYFGNRGNGYQHFVSTAHPTGMKEYEYIGKIPLIVESNDAN